MLNFTNFGVFPPEATKAGLTLKYSMLEISSGMCTSFAAGQLPPEMDGAPCVTHWNNFRLDTTGTKATDTPFEAQCRTDFEATYKTQPVGKGFPPITKTNPGVPYPGFKDATGKQLDMDQSYYECNLMNIVKVGITGAGGNLTKKTFQEAIFKQKDFDAAGIAGGKGTLAANKLWLASNVQQVRGHGQADVDVRRPGGRQRALRRQVSLAAVVLPHGAQHGCATDLHAVVATRVDDCQKGAPAFGSAPLLCCGVGFAHE